jgi:hypothetical protein
VRMMTISPKVFGFAVSTRAALAFGLGLLAADRLPRARRRQIALSLIGLGAATTLPLARQIFGGDRRRRRSENRGLDPQLDLPPM